MKREQTPYFGPLHEDDLAAAQAILFKSFQSYAAYLGPRHTPKPYDELKEFIALGQVHGIWATQKLIGLAVVSQTGLHWYLDRICLLPSMQRRGLGQQLLAYIELKARSAHAQDISLRTVEVATELITFYQRNGYEIVKCCVPRDAKDRVVRAYLRKSFLNASKN